MEADTERQLARIGAQISPRTIVRRLSPAQQQFVAIARALSMNARLLVLDEPTASLGSSEAERLFAVLQDLRSSGTAIVYISHRLREIEALADRAAVLRDGRNAGVLQRGEITRDRLVQLMVGRADRQRRRGRPAHRAGEARRGRRRLQLDRVRTRRYPAVEVSLTVNRGEVLGVAGLIGAGRSELAEAICGVVAARVRTRPARRRAAGDSTRRATPSAPASAWCPRIAAAAASSAPMTVRENITLPALASYARLGVVKRAAETSAADDIAAALTVQSPVDRSRRWRRSAAATSRRWCSANGWRSQPRVIIFDEPTQGVDVGAKAEIHRLIRRLADEGAAVVMISSDMDEIVAESDRVAVMHEGRITGILDRAACTPESIMQLAVA